MNGGGQENSCYISTWIPPKLIILLSGPQIFSAMKQVGLENSYNPPSTTLLSELHP